jgi:retinol dehydrogenase 12
VVVSSNAHFDADEFDYDRVRGRTRSLTGVTEYRMSKLANVWFGLELARRFSVAVHIVHPGMVATDIWRRIPWPIRPLLTRRMATPAEGAATPVWAVNSAGLESGGYFARCAERTPSELARDDAAAAELWERSEEWLRVHRRRDG